MSPPAATRPSGVSAIVLAGGRSSRFGADKLAEHLGGEALLDRAVAAVRKIADEVIVAGRAAPGDLHDVVLTTARDRARVAAVVRAIPDVEPFAGPLVALAGALDHASLRSAVVVGGDMPCLVPAVLGMLLARLDEDGSIEAVTLAAPSRHEAGTAPRRQVLPLALAVEQAHAMARSALAAGDRSLVSLVDRLRSAEVPASAWLRLDPNASTLVDVDTPADLERIRRHELR